MSRFFSRIVSSPLITVTSSSAYSSLSYRKQTFSIDNAIIDNREKIANEFNNFFVSIGHNLANNITCNVNPLIYVNSVNDSVVVQHVSVAQVRNVITSLKDSSRG